MILTHCILRLLCLITKDAMSLQVERGDIMSAYYRRLTSEDEKTRLAAARTWSRWEMSTSRLMPDEEMLKRAESDIWSLQFARIEWYVHVALMLG